MKVTSPVLYASAFTFSIVSIACGVQAQAPDTPQSAPAPSGAQTQTHSRNDSSSLVVIGLLAGGAALMAGGGHGSSGSSSGVAVQQPQARQPQASQPQVLITGTLPHAAPINSAPAVISFVRTAAGNGAKPAVVFTLPGIPTDSPTAELDQSPDVQENTITPATNTITPVQVIAPLESMPDLLRGSGLRPQNMSLPAKVTSVPEPPASLALALGSFGLAGLLLRARRRSIAKNL